MENTNKKRKGHVKYMVNPYLKKRKSILVKNNYRYGYPVHTDKPVHLIPKTEANKDLLRLAGVGMEKYLIKNYKFERIPPNLKGHTPVDLQDEKFIYEVKYYKGYNQLPKYEYNGILKPTIWTYNQQYKAVEAGLQVGGKLKHGVYLVIFVWQEQKGKKTQTYLKGDAYFTKYIDEIVDSKAENKQYVEP